MNEAVIWAARRLLVDLERQLPFPDKTYLKKHQSEVLATLGKFIESGEAVCARQKNHKDRETGRIFIFLPTGRARNGERSYLIYAASKGEITGQRFAYLPMAYDVVSNRQKEFNQNPHYHLNVTLAQRRSRLMSSDVWTTPRKIYHASEYSKEKKLTPIFDGLISDKLGREGVRAFVKDMLDIIYERNSDVAPEEKPNTQNYMEVAGFIEYALSQHERENVKAALKEFRGYLDPEAENVIEVFSGQITPEWYSYLNPTRVVETITRNESGKRIKKTHREVDEKKADYRRAFATAYPLATSIERFTRLTGDILTQIDKGADPDMIAARLWLVSNSETSMSIIRKLRHQTENSVGQVTAKNMRKIAPYLSFIDEKSIPQTPDEWSAFSKIVEADQKLRDCRFREHGRTVSDFDKNVTDSSEWIAAADLMYPSDPQARYESSPIDKIKTLANRIALSNISVFIRHFMNDHPVADLDFKKEIIPICTLTSDAGRRRGYGYKATEMLTRTGNFPLVSLMYQEMSIQEILEKAEQYWKDYPEFEEWMSRLALSNLFLGHAKDIEWPEFPQMPEALRAEKKDDGSGLINHVEHINSSFKALQLAQRMRSLFAFDLQDSFRSGGHYVAAFRKATGEPLGICKLIEKQSSGDDILQVEIDRESLEGPYGDSVRLNSVIEDIRAYEDFINAQQIPARTYRNIRAKYEMKAREIATETDNIGYDDSIMEQRVAMTERLAPYRPDDYQQVSDTGTILSVNLRVWLGQMYFGKEPYRLVRGGGKTEFPEKDFKMG